MATTKKTGAKKAPANKTAANRTAAKKSTNRTAAKKTPAKTAAKSAAKKSPAKKSPAKKSASATKGRGKVEKVMHEYKHGELKSGGKKKVKNPKQAIAIALSEARRSGAKIPPKKAKKTAGRKR